MSRNDIYLIINALIFICISNFNGIIAEEIGKFYENNINFYWFYKLNLSKKFYLEKKKLKKTWEKIFNQIIEVYANLVLIYH
jgi:hypothetical protein